MEVFAVYAGRFHPFHRGHASSFDQLVAKFGIEHTLLAISGKQEQPKSPFSAGDRAKMAIALGIPKENIIVVKQPYRAEEYIKYIENKDLDPQNFALVFGVSKKDMEGVPEMGIPPDPRFEFKAKKDGSPSYLQPYSGNENSLKDMLQHAYVFSTDVAEFPIAGESMRDASAIRRAYTDASDERKDEILHDLYGSKAAKHIKPIFDKELCGQDSIIKEYHQSVKSQLPEIKNTDYSKIDKKLRDPTKEFKWTDYDAYDLSITDKIKIAESFFTHNGNLFESNDPEKSQYFLSLMKMSSPVVKKKKYIITLLGFINNNVLQMQSPEVVTLLDTTSDGYKVLRRNGDISDFPDNYVSKKITLALFFFDNINAYDKFKNFMSLKYDFNLISQESIDGIESLRPSTSVIKEYYNRVRPLLAHVPLAKRAEVMRVFLEARANVKKSLKEDDLDEVLNLKSMTRGFQKRKDMGWYELVALGDFVSRHEDDHPTLQITAHLPRTSPTGRAGKQIGGLLLKLARGPHAANQSNPQEKMLYAVEVDVDPEYQRKGVASSMYAFAKELGNDVTPSIDQTDDGKAMWAGMKKKGIAEDTGTESDDPGDYLEEK